MKITIKMGLIGVLHGCGFYLIFSKPHDVTVTGLEAEIGQDLEQKIHTSSRMQGRNAKSRSGWKETNSKNSLESGQRLKRSPSKLTHHMLV